jgi:hypothetical protein
MKHDAAFYCGLREILRAILCYGERLPVARVTLRIGGTSTTFIGDFKMQLPDDKSVSATASFVDAKGNAAQVQGTPVWETDRPDLLVMIDNGIGSVIVSALGPLGSGQVTCTGDADLGDGVVPVILLGTVEVIAGTAVGGVINFGAPV